MLKDTEHQLKDIPAVAGPIPCLPNFLLYGLGMGIAAANSVVLGLRV